MPITAEVKARIEATLPPVQETRDRLREFITRSDLSRQQVATMCGYSPSAIDLFLKGTYTSYSVRTDVLLRRAIEDMLARHPLGAPETESDGRLYETENVADLRHWFRHCHANRALAFCYGPPGSQKTFVLKHLVAEFNRSELGRTDGTHRAFYVRASVRMQPRDLLVKLCAASGAVMGASLQRCIAGLRHQLANTQTCFVIDEAQHLSIDCLEALRELHDESPRVGVLLAGSHNLKMLFSRRASELEQWNSRLDAGIELQGISEHRAQLMILAELPGLSDKKVATLIEGARVPDAYSRTNTSYLNVRRLFKNLDAYRRALAERAATGIDSKGAAA